ncbi:MAG: nucleotidyl transferase AbiEii/AbiGii toxin family protein [Deltaproteobacteria bacterium]|nr:nucleotidyl transferase AbiEii/AbiGii toxin family protein [Deltaproteobacteria bacterium]
MKTSQTYASPAAFKQALEQRLRTASATGVDFARRRQLLVFDRFLARVVQIMGDTVLLKGGLAIELRMERARTTKDVDLRLTGSSADVLEHLRQAGRLDLGDFLAFEIRPDPEHPDIRQDGMPYEGFRYRAEAKLAGKPYGQPFGVDVAFGDPIVGEPDVVVTDDLLGFAGVAPPTLHLYPIESHIAEKLHAYTLPRQRENSRVKDLPDLALLGCIREIDATHLRQALERTFAFRNTHPLPAAIPAPPASWKIPYQRMADEDDLPWRTLADVLSAVGGFLDPVLRGEPVRRWSPTMWTWSQA